MKLFSLVAAASAWEQPKYWDAMTAARTKISGWGYPIGVKAAADATMCPEMALPAGAASISYDGSTAMIVCQEGYQSVGRRRTKCRFKPNRGFYWKTTLAGCTTCEDTYTTEIHPDSGITTECSFVGKKAKKTCFHTCPSGSLFNGRKRTVKSKCKCSRRNNGCSWIVKAGFPSFGALTCLNMETGVATPTLTSATSTDMFVNSTAPTITSLTTPTATPTTVTSNTPTMSTTIPTEAITIPGTSSPTAGPTTIPTIIASSMAETALTPLTGDKVLECSGTICTLTTPHGTFIGENDDDNGVVKFRSVPYAQPPLGDLRWKAPIMIDSYPTTVDASREADMCAGSSPAEPGMSENCLFLNIQVSKDVFTNGQQVPILYFIHGGGFSAGSGQGEYHTAVTNQGVMVVGVNYRLSAFGFLYLNQMEQDQTYQGNWGLLDQQAGMKWVRRFGALFGGDVDNVTLTGGSAGSESVWHHFTIPTSWDYFTRVAPVGIGLVAGSKGAGARTQEVTNGLYSFAQCAVDDLACLRSKSTDEIAGFVNQNPSMANQITENHNIALVLNSVFSPTYNGTLLGKLL